MALQLDDDAWMIESRKSTDMKDDYEVTTHYQCGKQLYGQHPTRATRPHLTTNEGKYGIVPIRRAFCKAYPHATLGFGGNRKRRDVMGRIRHATIIDGMMMAAH